MWYLATMFPEQNFTGSFTLPHNVCTVYEKHPRFQDQNLILKLGLEKQLIPKNIKKLTRKPNKRGNVRINVAVRRFSVTILAVEKAVSIKYSECVSVSLVVRHALRMRRTGI